MELWNYYGIIILFELRDLSKLLGGFLSSCYMDLSKLKHVFLQNTWICQNLCMDFS